MAFDLKQYRKVHHTPHHSIFRHPDGHEIKVLHDKLDPKTKAEVMKLPKRNAAPMEGYADGGKVKPAPQAPKAPQGPQIAPQDAANVRKAFVGYSNGTPDGPIPNAAAASTRYGVSAALPDTSPTFGPSDNLNLIPQPAPQPGIWERLTTPIPGASHSEGFNMHPEAVYTPKGGIEHSLGSPSVVQSAQPDVEPALEMDQSAYGGTPDQVQPQAPEPDMFADYGKQLTTGFDEQRRGVNAEAKALGDQGVAEAKLLDTQQTDQANQQVEAKRQFDELNNDFNAAYEDLKEGHIDPNHYMGSMDTSGKISTAIGLILGGMGGGLTGGGNPVLDFMNKQIDRDIQAQQANLNKKESLLSANLKHFGNVRDGIEATRVMMMDGVKLGLQKAAASAQDPLAKARALQAVGMIDNKKAEATLGLANKRAMMTAGSSGNPDKMLQQMRVLDPPRAKEMEGRYVPGIGFASVPIEPKVRDEISIRHELDDKLARLEAFAHKNGGSLSPATMREGKALAQDAQDVYRRANGQGVFREAEAEFVNKMIDSDPTKFFGSVRTLPAYKAVREGNAAALDGRLRSVGLPVPVRAKRRM